MRRRGKGIAILAVVGGLLVLIAAGFMSRDWILERWYVRKLVVGDEVEKKVAAESLGAMGSVRAIPSLIQIIREDKAVRAISFRKPYPGVYDGVYSGMPIWFPGGIAHLKGLEPDFWEHYWPGKMLVRIGPRAIPALAKAIEDDDEFVSIVASESLAEIGPDAVSPLTQQLKSAKHNQIVDRVFYALARMGPRSSAAVPTLCDLLRRQKKPGEDLSLQEKASWTLGHIGSNASAAISVLKELANHSNEDLRGVAWEALKKIQGTQDEAKR